MFVNRLFFSCNYFLAVKFSRRDSFRILRRIRSARLVLPFQWWSLRLVCRRIRFRPVVSDSQGIARAQETHGWFWSPLFFGRIVRQTKGSETRKAKVIMPIASVGLGGIKNQGFTYKRKRCPMNSSHVFHNGVCILCNHRVARYASLYCAVCGKPKSHCRCKKWADHQQAQLSSKDWNQSAKSCVMDAGYGREQTRRQAKNSRETISFMAS